MERRSSSLRPARERGRPRRRGLVVILVLAAFALLAVGLVAGIAVGRALEQAPRPGGTQTLVRTLEPTTLTPRSTVTVTAPNG